MDEKKPKGKPGPMKGDPRAVAGGKKGGDTVKAERGPEFFKEIGRKGGQATKEKHGPEYFAEIGKKGGQAVKAAHGPEFYADIGRKGGATERKKR